MLNKVAVKILISFIRLYQIIISPLLPNSCRFHPSCSSYSLKAFEEYGVIKGFILSFKRIIKCHPLGKGGYDPLK